jgi:hypothetical protein
MLTYVRSHARMHARTCTHAHVGTWILHMHSYTCICNSRRLDTHSSFRLGHSAATGSAASSVLDASLRANRAAAPSSSGPPLTRRATPPPRHPTRRRAVQRPGAAAHAQRRQRRTLTRRRGGGTGRTGTPRACTGRATRGAPERSWRRCPCRAPRARAARTRRATMGGRGGRAQHARDNGQTWGRTG